MKLDYKYTIIYTLVSLLLFWIVVKYGTNVLTRFCSTNKVLKEGLTDFEKYSQQIIPYPKDAVINYNDVNSPLYSRTVNLPINDPVSCKNFCGPNATCLLTGEQCTSDIDCYGCNPGPKPQSACTLKEVMPYDATGKLGQNLGLQYSPLTTGYNNHNINFAEIYPGSKDTQITLPYQGLDLWTKSFNKGLELYNRTRKSAEKYSEGISNAIPLASNNKLPSLDYEPKYPMTVSLTGQFYETTPPASNSSVSTQNLNSSLN
jgi:hypothetical protein